MTDMSTSLKTKKQNPRSAKSHEATAESWILQKRNLKGQK